MPDIKLLILLRTLLECAFNKICLIQTPYSFVKIIQKLEELMKNSREGSGSYPSGGI